MVNDHLQNAEMVSPAKCAECMVQSAKCIVYSVSVAYLDKLNNNSITTQ